MLRKNDNASIECNKMWDTLDLNYPDDVVKVSTEEDVQKHCKNAKKMCLTAWKKYGLKNGGEPSDLANYCDFEFRDPDFFSRCNNEQGPTLTWIHMLDKSKGGPLRGQR